MEILLLSSVEGTRIARRNSDEQSSLAAINIGISVLTSKVTWPTVYIRYWVKFLNWIPNTAGRWYFIPLLNVESAKKPLAITVNNWWAPILQVDGWTCFSSYLILVPITVEYLCLPILLTFQIYSKCLTKFWIIFLGRCSKSISELSPLRDMSHHYP